MKTKYLSKEEREQGTKYFLHWATFNGLGFSFLGDTIIYLLAIHFGASNMQLGYVSSVIHVSGVVLLIFPWLLAGTNIIKIFYYSWLLRGVICIFYGALFFVSGQTAVIIILILYTLFCLFRTFGFAVMSLIQQMLSTSSTTGEFVVTLSNRFQSTRFVSQFVSFLLLSFQYFSGIAGYLFLITLGIITNTVGTLKLTRIPCRETVEYRRGQNIFHIFVRSLRNRERALTLFVKWHVLSLMVILPFIIPFLRKIAHFQPNMIFLYTLTGTLAIIVAGYVLRPFTDRIGSRPVMIMASFLLTGVSILWCIIPPTIHRSVFFVLGFLTIFLQGSLFLLASRLEIRSIPEQDKMGYVSMMNFFSAIISLGMGLFGGFLADLGERLIFPGIHSFGLTFFIAVILSMQTGLLSFLIKDAGSLSIKDTAQILFSTRNLKAFLDVYHLHGTDDLNTRKAILLSIGKSDTPVAVDEIRQILRNPLSMEKREALISLFAYPKPELVNDIIREASDEHSYQRVKAIFALGAYPVQRVEDLLLSLLDCPTPSIRSMAAKSLARVGNTTALPVIREFAFDPALNITDKMNYFIAMSFMDQQGTYLAHLFDIAGHQQDRSYEQTMLALAARLLETQPPLADLYQNENLKPTVGLAVLLEEAKPLKPFCEHSHQLIMNYTQKHYQQIWEWCRDILSEKEFEDHFRYLKYAISTYDVRYANKDNTFAALYFTYQSLR